MVRWHFRPMSAFRTIAVPLARYPRLLATTSAQREHWKICAAGHAIATKHSGGGGRQFSSPLRGGRMRLAGVVLATVLFFVVRVVAAKTDRSFIVLHATHVAGPSVTASDLHPRPIVLDFWATWCAPCVASLPHLERLSQKFGDRVTFVAITDEAPAAVEAAVAARYPSVTFMSDTARSIFDRFSVTRLPTTLLLDASGNEWARTTPLEIQEDELTALLLKKKPPRSATPRRNNEAVMRLAQDSVMLSALIPSTQLIATGETSPRILVSRGLTIRALLSIAYDVPGTRITFELPEPPFRYDYYLKPPGSASEVRTRLQAALAAAFGPAVRRENRTADGILVVITVPDKLRKHVGEFQGSSIASGDGTLEGIGITLHDLAQQLEFALGKPVLLAPEIDAGLRYDIHIEWSAWDPNSLRKSVAAELGIELRNQPITVPVLVVTALTIASSP